MLTLDYLDPIQRVCEAEQNEFLHLNAALLEEAKKGHAEFSDSLGWLDTEKWAGEETLAAIEKIAARIRSNSQAFVLVGIGGSNNAARAVIEALRHQNSSEILYMGNTLSPHAINAALQQLENKSFTVNCIAKNFETLEPGASFRVLRELLYRRYGDGAKHRIICTGTPGSLLEALCKEQGYEFLSFPEDIGGRYTALSNVGLLPMAVAGVDIRAVIRGAAKMRKQLFQAGPEDNLAFQYACLRNQLYRKGFRLELLSSFEPQFRWFYKWWTQLFAESEGKDGKGLFPVACEFSEELHSVGQYIQDGESLMFETFLNVAEQNASLKINPTAISDGFDYLNGKNFWEINKASLAATRTAHSKKLPCLTLTVDRLDAESFGGLFYFFQFACYLSGVLLGVNPFDQPGVEAYKGWMFKALGKYSK